MADISDYVASNSRPGPRCRMDETVEAIREKIDDDESPAAPGEVENFFAALRAGPARVQHTGIVRRLDEIGVQVNFNFVRRHRPPVECLNCRDREEFVLEGQRG